MGIPVCLLAVILMFSGVHSISQSMSCSTVNGKTICNKQNSQGNTAMSSSSSFSGPGSSSQQTYAGAGDPNGQWQSSGQSVNSGSPGGFYNPFSDFANTGSQASTGGFGNPQPEYSYHYSSSGYPNDYYYYDYPDHQTFAPSGGSSNSYDDSPASSSGSFAGPLPGGAGAFAGGFSSGGFSNSYDDSPSFTSTSGSYAGPLPGGVGAFAGGFPFGGFSNSYDDTPSFASNSGSFAGPSPSGVGAFAGGFAFPGFGPMSFVPNVGSFVGSMAGGAGSFGFASAGAFPFLQPGIAYPPQDYDESSDGAPPPQGSNGPADFVNQFMGGGFGGFGGGAFAFGRR